MKNNLQPRIPEALVLCMFFLFLGNHVFAQEADNKVSSQAATVQQIQENRTSDQNQKMQQQDQKKSGELQQKQQQVKNVKKVKDSSPDLTQKKGARPPSISRPGGNTMPKGAGKPAGVIRPGRR